MARLCPLAVWRPVPSHSGPVAAHLGLVVHVQVGDGSCYGEFSNPNNEASSTWWIAKDGTLEQYVDADEIAWTEMAGNPDYDSVETEGMPTEAWTPQQCQTLAKLIGWGHQTFGWPLQLVDHGAAGITTHAHYPSGVPDPAWGDHACPGAIRAGQLPAVLAAAQLIVNPQEESNVAQLAAPIVAIVATPTGNGYWLIGQDGGTFAFGDAPVLTDPEVGKLQPGHFARAAACTPTGKGLWITGSDGGVLSLGDAKFHGSLGNLTPSSQPIEA